jgi:hypothetical protein
VIPRLQIVLTAPQWLVVTMLAFVIAAALFRIGLDLYVTHIRIEDVDQTRDDADKGARGVERHEEELEAIKVYLAARDDADTDEMPAVPTTPRPRTQRPPPTSRSRRCGPCRTSERKLPDGASRVPAGTDR